MQTIATPSGVALWGRGFRPFFLAASLYAAGVVPWWLGVWTGAAAPHAWLWPAAWHAHEMLFGVVAAAIAGFLLTSVPVWTNTRALSGAPLAALALVWLAGRLAMAGAGRLPAAWLAAIDLAFLPALGAVLARALLPSRQTHNLGFLVVIAALALCNAGVHAQALGLAVPAAQALRLGVDLVVLLIVVIGGRITPAFTRNALARQGVDAPVRARAWLDRAAVAGAAGLALADLVAPRSQVSGVLALAAALAGAGRMAGWQTLRTRGDPLVWSLHAGLAWVVIGLALVAASDLGAALPPAAGLHALAAGAMGSMLLAVMTRVALGHTGRMLVLPRGAVLCYVLVHLGAGLRVAAAALPAAPRGLLVCAGVSWSLAFALYAALYARILVAPRVDGRPG
ncbi:MAG TPA: NnrS family protein [Myxococcota bacterium]|nr:NnrS family protein [Myxococcota bacterium]